MRMKVALRREAKPPQLNSCRNGAAIAEVLARKRRHRSASDTLTDLGADLSGSWAILGPILTILRSI